MSPRGEVYDAEGASGLTWAPRTREEYETALRDLLAEAYRRGWDDPTYANPYGPLTLDPPGEGARGPSPEDLVAGLDPAAPPPGWEDPRPFVDSTGVRYAPGSAITAEYAIDLRRDPRTWEEYLNGRKARPPRRRT